MTPSPETHPSQGAADGGAAGQDALESAATGRSDASVATSTPLVALTPMLPARFALEYHLVFERNAAGADGGTRSETFRVDVTALLDVAEADDDRTLQARLVSPVVHADTTARALMGLDGTQPARGFERPFLLTIVAGAEGDRAQGVASPRFDPAMPEAARALVATLASDFQLVPPPDALPLGASSNILTWSMREARPDGEVDVTYAQPDPGRILKRWTAARGGSPLQPERRAPVRTEGETTFELDAARRPIVGRTRHALVASLANAGRRAQTITATVTAELRWLEDGDDDWASALSRDTLEAELVRPKTPPPEPPRPAASNSATVSPIARVQSAAEASARQDWRTRREHLQALVETMERDPAALREVTGWLAAPVSPGVDLRTIVEAVLRVDHPLARAAVSRTLALATAPVENRRALTQAASFMSRPEPELVLALQTISRDRTDLLAGDALLALAGQARMMAERDPVQAAAIGSDLVARARDVLAPASGGADDRGLPAPKGEVAPPPTPRAAPSLKLIMQWLQALGNLGGPEVFALVAPYTTYSSDHRIRRFAVDALRFVPTIPARQLLARIILEDRDEWVRRVAIEATPYQPQAAFEETVLRALERDRSPNVRLAAARTLARWGYQAPLLYDRIRRASMQEPNASVRDMMLGLLPVDHSGHAGHSGHAAAPTPEVQLP